MNKSTKIVLGAATIWPLVYIPLFMAAIFGMFFFEAPGPPVVGPLFGIIVVIHVFTILLSLGLTVFYVIHAIKNEALKGDMKAVWVVLFFFAGMIAEPVYWYLQIWKSPELEVRRGSLSEPRRPVWETEHFREGTYQPPDWR